KGPRRPVSPFRGSRTSAAPGPHGGGPPTPGPASASPRRPPSSRLQRGSSWGRPKPGRRIPRPDGPCPSRGGGRWHGSRCAPGMDGLRQDVRGALRLILRSPAFAGVVVLTLAVAIGATTSVFSVVRGLLLKPLPFRDSGKLVRFHTSAGQVTGGT